MQDYYTILGLDPGCTQQEIRKKYRRLALRYHPDHNAGNPQAEEMFKQIARAYETLGNPEKRKEYDLSCQKKSPSTKKTNTSSTTSTASSRKTTSSNRTETKKEKTSNFNYNSKRYDSSKKSSTYSSAKTSSSKDNQTYTSKPPFAKILLNAIKKHPIAKAGDRIAQKKEEFSSFLASIRHETKQDIDKKRREIQQQIDRVIARLRPKKEKQPEAENDYFQRKTKEKQPGKGYQWGELDIVYITPLNKTELKKGKNITVRVYSNATDEKYEFLDVTIPPNSRDGQRLRIRGKGHRYQLSEKRGDLYLHLVQEGVR